MASKPRGAAKVVKPEKDSGPPKAFIQSAIEATGASEEDVKQMLHDCNNDANEATIRLLDGAEPISRATRGLPRSRNFPRIRS